MRREGVGMDGEVSLLIVPMQTISSSEVVVAMDEEGMFGSGNGAELFD